MDMAGPQGVGYMRFPDLVIRQVGTYRIRITLVRMPTSNPSGSGVTIQIVDSNPIVVHGSGGTSSHAAYNGKYMVATYWWFSGFLMTAQENVDEGGWQGVARAVQQLKRSRRRWESPHFGFMFGRQPVHLCLILVELVHHESEECG
jgi:hypothetical protein